MLPGSCHVPGPVRSSKRGNLTIRLSAINRRGVEAEDGKGGCGHWMHGDLLWKLVASAALHLIGPVALRRVNRPLSR